MEFMGAKSFDPNNISLLTEFRDEMETMVMVHSDDLEDVSRIPNLLELKQRPWVRFITYENVFEVKHRSYTHVMRKGGLVVADDMVLLTMDPATLEEICEFMVQQDKISIPWRLQVSSLQ